MTNTSRPETFIEPEIDEYIGFLNASNTRQVNVLRRSRIRENLDLYTEALNTFLVYPDIYADLITPRSSSFSMFFAQRIVLRCMARHRQSFNTFTRAFSKSFLADFYGFNRATMIPHCNGFITAGTKGQAAQIAKEKIIQDLWVKFPIMKNEMVKTGAKAPYIDSGDEVEFRFTNGSVFNVVGGHPRGMRRNWGIFEEIIEQDPVVVNEEIIPLLNAPRTNCHGKINPHEQQAQKVYVTTAGYQGTFAYDKCMETLCYAALDPDNYMVLGGSYAIPLMHGRLDEQQMREILTSPSFDRDSLEREYISRWSGAQSGAIFTPNTITTLRKIMRAEYKAADTSNTEDFYVVSADMAKDGSADTAVVVYKVSPKEYMFNFKLVYPFVINSTDYEVVANELKKTIAKYDARLFVYDANGIGAALRDWMNKPTCDKNGMPLPGYGIINPPESSKRDIIKYNPHQTICYEIKTGGKEGERVHKVFFSRISNGSIRFLIKTSEALIKLQENKNFLAAPEVRKRQILQPYKYMDMMEEELKNLLIIDTSDNISNTMRVDRRDKKIQKDFFSAAEYGVYATHIYFEQTYYKGKRKRQNK